jgi:hypothetical protein
MCAWLLVRIYSIVKATVFSVSWGGMRLGPLGTSATNWPILPAPNDRRVWSSRWNDNWQGKPKYSKKPFSTRALSTTNPTRPDLGSNPYRRVGKPAANGLSCVTANGVFVLLYFVFVFTLNVSFKRVVQNIVLK